MSNKVIVSIAAVFFFLAMVLSAAVSYAQSPTDTTTPSATNTMTPSPTRTLSPTPTRSSVPSGAPSTGFPGLK